MKEFLLSQSLAIRTFTLSEVAALLNKITPTYDSTIPYKTSIIDWLKPIADLSEFYVYPINGITEGLNWWSGNSKNNIFREEGEYQWVDNIQDRLSPAVVYQSIPSAIDGNYKSIITDSIVALDLAYVGSTSIRKIEIPSNVNYVFYSLSKPFGVRNVRTGWYFTREPDKKLELLTFNAKYYNYYATAVSECIINNFDIDYVYNTLHQQQKQVCEELQLTASDSVWLATTTDPKYIKFRRKGNIARVCLSGLYKQ